MIDQILNAIYWRTFTPTQLKIIQNILGENISSTEMANDICEYLDIPKRDNRAAIIGVINKFKVNN